MHRISRYKSYNSKDFSKISFSWQGSSNPLYCNRLCIVRIPKTYGGIVKEIGIIFVPTYLARPVWVGYVLPTASSGQPVCSTPSMSSALSTDCTPGSAVHSACESLNSNSLCLQPAVKHCWIMRMGTPPPPRRVLPHRRRESMSARSGRKSQNRPLNSSWS